MCFRPPSMDQQTIECPMCGAVVEATATKCPKCGAEAVPDMPAIPPYAGRARSAGRSLCPHDAFCTDASRRIARATEGKERRHDEGN